MMLHSVMKDYLKQREDQSSTQGSELFGLVTEVADVPLEPETSEWIVHEQPERLVRQYSFEDVKIRNWFLREVLEEENNSGHFGKITIDGLSILMEVWTHDVDAVTELDVEYAHRCDDIFGDVDLLGGAGYGY